jgi:hypothetical protein
MGTSTANDARQREWVAPRGFLEKAVSRRSVACSDEKQVRKHFAKIESPARGQAAVLRGAQGINWEISCPKFLFKSPWAAAQLLIRLF